VRVTSQIVGAHNIFVTRFFAAQARQHQQIAVLAAQSQQHRHCWRHALNKKKKISGGATNSYHRARWWHNIARHGGRRGHALAWLRVGAARKRHLHKHAA